MITPGDNGPANGRRFNDAATRFIRDVGFPVFVAVYLLFSLGPKVDHLSALIERQTIILERLK